MTVFKRWLFKPTQKNNDTNITPRVDTPLGTRPVIRNARKGQPIILKRYEEHKESSPPLPQTPTSPVQKNVEERQEQQQQQFHAELNKHRETVLNQLEHEKRTISETAYNEGFKSGEADGKARYDALCEELKNTINSISNEKHALLAQTEQGVLELSIDVAEKIIQTKIANDPTVFHNILKEALDRVTDRDRIIIRINPNEIESVRNYQETFKRELKDFKHVDLKADPEISPGGCVIETNLGYIDSSITTKLALIKDALLKTYHEKSQ